MFFSLEGFRRTSRLEGCFKLISCPDPFSVFQPHHFLVYQCILTDGYGTREPFLGGQEPRKHLALAGVCTRNLLCS